MLVKDAGAGGTTAGAEAGGGAARGTAWMRGLPLSFATTRSSVAVTTSAAGPRNGCSAGPYARRQADGRASLTLASKAAAAASPADSALEASAPGAVPDEGADGAALADAAVAGAFALTAGAGSFDVSAPPQRPHDTAAQPLISAIAAALRSSPWLTSQA
jgi:hypothetical protein